MTTAVCMDLDNLEHRGFEKTHNVPRARAQFNPLAFAEELRDLNITQATVLQNRSFGPVAEQLWRKLGFKVQAVGANCDGEVSKVAMSYAKAGADRIILCAGDSDYLQTVRALKELGVQVIVWVRRASASQKLISEADGAMYIDRFLIEPAPANSNATTRRAAPPMVSQPGHAPGKRSNGPRLRAPPFGIQGRMSSPDPAPGPSL